MTLTELKALAARAREGQGKKPWPFAGWKSGEEVISEKADHDFFAALSPDVVTALVDVVMAAKAFMDDAPIGDDDLPYLSDVSPREFEALAQSLTTLERVTNV